MKKTLFISIVTASALMAASSGDVKVDGTNALVTHTELSFVQTQGNTDTTAFALDFAGKKAWGASSMGLDLDAIYGTQDNIENKNRAIGELNFNHSLTERFALNYVAGYKSDKFSGFDYQFYTGPGFRYTVYNSKAHHLDLKGNLLYSIDQGSDKYFDAVTGDEIKYPYADGKAGATRTDGEYSDGYGYLFGLNYYWQITDSLKFLQEATYRNNFANPRNYFVTSKTGLESKFSDMLSMGVSYKINYTNLPPQGNELADKTLLVSLIIDY